MRAKRSQGGKAFVLLELLVVLGIMGMITGVTLLSFNALWGNLRFKRQAEEVVNTLQMAQDAAATTGRRYQVSLNTTLQGYVFREYTETEIAYDRNIIENAEMGLYDDSLIRLSRFNEALTLDGVIYDYYTKEDIEGDLETVDVFHFIAGRSGWLAGGKIMLLDEDGLPWTIVVSRFAAPVKLVKGDVDIYVPQTADNIRF